MSTLKSMTFPRRCQLSMTPKINRGVGVLLATDPSQKRFILAFFISTSNHYSALLWLVARKIGVYVGTKRDGEAVAFCDGASRTVKVLKYAVDGRGS